MVRTDSRPHKMKDKFIVIDMDGTLCKSKKGSQEYIDVEPNNLVIQKLKEYKSLGFSIAILSARNMRTYKGNIGKINAVTLKTILQWLDKHDVPYDEVYIGKPWCGLKGFYVDDKTIRQDEFINLSYKEIKSILDKNE